MSDRYRWAMPGDINAFFGLLLDNIAGMVLIVSLLDIFGLPASFSLRYMIPGTAIGVLVGDLCYFYMAFRLAKKTGNNQVTAMPLGLDTPSIFGIMLFVIGPAFLKAKSLDPDIQSAAMHAWYIGIGCLFMSGIFKLLCASGSNWVRNTLPRAGLLGSLTAVALVLISFLPLLDVMATPIVGMSALAIVLISLLGMIPLPLKLPGTVAALLVGGFIYYVMLGFNLLHSPPQTFNPALGLVPTEWLQAWTFGWWGTLGEAAVYLPIVLPFALGTVVGGIDCTESAAAAGDHYSTGQVIGVEAFATLAAALCGGVAQSTPYIGHPAYKAMGGRAAYVLATALVIGIGGLLGLYGYFYTYVPKAAVYPILIFIGLEITAQSFAATPKKHYPAIALACVPALAWLSVCFVGQIFGDPALQNYVVETRDGVASLVLDDKQQPKMAPIGLDQLKNGALHESIVTAKALANGFIITALLWSSALAMAIDRRLNAAALLFAIAGALTLFGVIHSPLDTNAVFFPIGFPGISPDWVLAPEQRPLVFQFTVAYFVTAALLVVWARLAPPLDDVAEHA